MAQVVFQASTVPIVFRFEQLRRAPKMGTLTGCSLSLIRERIAVTALPRAETENENTFTHERFVSPFTWRYGSDAMRRIWSEIYKRQTWRRLWVALASAQAEAGLVTADQVADLRNHQNDIDINAALAFERELQHDLMAEVRVYAEQCAIGGGVIHLGATSMDIEDNADALRLRESLALVLDAMRGLLNSVADQITHWADKPCVAFTHIQPAEPTTVGYRLALYGQDLLADYVELQRVHDSIRGKGIKGAVGTSASYVQLLTGTPLNAAQLESRIMAEIGLTAYPVAGQTYPRKQDWLIAAALAGLASSLHKFAFDMRILQSPAIGEWAEPFGKQQVGSSAMPFKRNPINAEKIDSLARLVASMVHVAWDNASQSLLERTLDDSANRRELFPVLFLASDEMLKVTKRLIDGLRIDERAIARNMDRFGTFAAIERLMMELVKAGASRQEMHEVLREHSLHAWAMVADGQPNPLIDAVCTDPALLKLLPADRIRALMDASDYVGLAPAVAREMADLIRGATAR
jgi:adenylosuccinate lyase